MKKTHDKSVIEVHIWEGVRKIQDSGDFIILQVIPHPPQDGYKPTYSIEKIARVDWEPEHFTQEEFVEFGWVSPIEYAAKIDDMTDQLLQKDQEQYEERQKAGYADFMVWYMTNLVTESYPDIDPQLITDQINTGLTTGHMDLDWTEFLAKLKGNSFGGDTDE